MTTLAANGHKYVAPADLAEVRRLQLQIEQLRAENTELRKRLHYNGRAVRVAQRAKRDALLFAADILAERDVSLIAMQARHGMPRRRWENARAALRAVDMADRYYRLRTTNIRAVMAALNDLIERVEDDGSAEIIYRHLPAWRRRERLRW